MQRSMKDSSPSSLSQEYRWDFDFDFDFDFHSLHRAIPDDAKFLAMFSAAIRPQTTTDTKLPHVNSIITSNNCSIDMPISPILWICKVCFCFVFTNRINFSKGLYLLCDSSFDQWSSFIRKLLQTVLWENNFLFILKTNSPEITHSFTLLNDIFNIALPFHPKYVCNWEFKTVWII